MDGIVFPDIFIYNTVQSVNDGDGYLVDVNFGWVPATYRSSGVCSVLVKVTGQSIWYIYQTFNNVPLPLPPCLCLLFFFLCLLLYATQTQVLNTSYGNVHSLLQTFMSYKQLTDSCSRFFSISRFKMFIDQNTIHVHWTVYIFTYVPFAPQIWHTNRAQYLRIYPLWIPCIIILLHIIQVQSIVSKYILQ